MLRFAPSLHHVCVLLEKACTKFGSCLHIARLASPRTQTDLIFPLTRFPMQFFDSSQTDGWLQRYDYFKFWGGGAPKLSLLGLNAVVYVPTIKFGAYDSLFTSMDT